MNGDLLEELELLLLDWQDGQLDDGGISRLREILRSSKTAQKQFLRMQALDAAIFCGASYSSESEAELGGCAVATVTPKSSLVGIRRSALLAMVAAVVALLSGATFWLRSTAEVKSTLPTQIADRNASDEATSHGIALVTRLVDVQWASDSRTSDVGEALRPGFVSIESGLAQIEFFCGATVVLEGPAQLELLSADAVRFLSGRLRAQVPPAARGFSVDVGEMKIVDLGTEFGVSMSAEGADVQVFDGEVELHSPGRSYRRVTAGEAFQAANGNLHATELTPNRFVDIADLDSLARRQTDTRYQRWHEFSLRLRNDPRLIVYYSFSEPESWHRRLASDLVPSNRELDGAIVGARQIAGRWPHKSALEFKQPGDRVRVSIPGEFGSLSLMAWVRIDSLDRWYNSLFLTDSYQQGEPHWQILDTGQLFFSVRVSDVDGGPEHREVLSPPFWTPTLSGKWLHLTTTYDTEEQTVTHYLNGEVLSRESIPDAQIVRTTRFGPASIGNWSTPTKPDERFAIRNLNGRIDEFAVFAAVIEADEVREMYENGKP